ncbi:MAG: hypothetical protein JNK53_06045 [Phycisphaerae bacterium]|nr:hypothetical protein [Phycisphaerae bacterium]
MRGRTTNAVRACTLALIAALALAGCTTTVPVAEQTLAARPAAWLAVVPRQVAATPAFTRLAAARRAEYEVTVVEYDPASGTPAQRLALVQSAIASATRTATDGVHGFVFIVGSPNAIPMGPWEFEGVAQAIYTDLPLSAALDTSSGRIGSADWHAALTAAPKWVVGRLPYDDPGVVGAALQGSLAHMGRSTSTSGHALLAATGVAEGWAMAAARGQIQRDGWSAELAGATGSCDVSAPGGLLPLWSAQSPRIVAIAAPTPDPSTTGALQGMLVNRASSDASAASSPALLVAFTGSFGHPDDDTMRSLFAGQWTAGIVAFTAPVAPFPVGPAWQMAITLPHDLAQGATLGTSTEAARRRFWSQSGRDVGLIMPGTDRWRAHTALSLAVVGDPALRAAQGDAPPTTASTGLPIVAPQTATSPPPEPTTAAIAAAPDPAADHMWPKWLGLGALMLFFIAVAAWLVARRSSPGSAA